MPGIRCDDGPQVFREWLGRQFVDPWIKVERCISYKCKPLVKKFTKGKLRKNTLRTIITVDDHVKCKFSFN